MVLMLFSVHILPLYSHYASQLSRRGKAHQISDMSRMRSIFTQHIKPLASGSAYTAYQQTSQHSTSTLSSGVWFQTNTKMVCARLEALEAYPRT